MLRSVSREKAGGTANRWVWIGGAALLVLTPLAIWLSAFAPRAARRARLEARLEQSVRDFQEQRWERPVLRGEAIDGNAIDAQVEAIRDFTPIDAAHFDGLRELLARGDGAPPALRALVSDNAEALARYRASTQRDHAWGGAYVDLSTGAPSEDWLPHVRAGRLVLASALGRSPRECLEICTDTLRLGQDRSAGTGLVPLMILAAHAADVLDLASRCLREADRDAVENAARELAILAEHPASAGSAMELEALTIGASLRMEAANTPSIPTDSLEWERWRQSWDLPEAWEILMGEPASMRSIGDDYPADIDRVEGRQRDLAALGNDVIGMAALDYPRFLRRDAATRAIVRILLAAARIRLEHDEPPSSAPSLLEDPALADPTSGRPFTWTREGDEGTISSRTIGALQHGELAVRVSWPRGPEDSVPELLADEAEGEREDRDSDGGRDVDDGEHGP